MNIRASLVFIVLLTISTLVNAQQNSLRQVDVSLAAPEATEIAKYGNLEVNLFKGVPNVSVPIHTLEIQDFSLPIFLSYDAGGIKVDQIATNVGLGWSLHAGGQITVAAYGKDEFTTPVEDFVQDPAKLQSFDPNRWVSGGDTVGLSDYKTAWNMYDATTGGNHLNLKPDVFYYSFAGSNGKFVITGDVNQQFSHYTVPYRKLKISYFTTNGFQIIDKSGNTYIFDELDKANITTDTNNCYGGPGSENGQADPIQSPKLGKESVTWHLGKIITSAGEVIDFTYDSSQTSYTYIQSQIHQIYERTSAVAECKSTISDYNCTTLKSIAPKRLSSITHQNSGKAVKFVYATTARQDFGNTTYTALDSIIVKRNNNILKAFDLDTETYFGSGDAMRLKLAGVKQEGYPSGYTFEYDPIALPARLSKSQDHWGFYNGKSNTTLIPDYHVTGGGDRSVDTSKVGAWSLNRINYPTGGSTILNMEGIPTGGGLRAKSIYDLNGMGDTTGTRKFTYEVSNKGDFYYADIYEYYLEGDYETDGDASCKYNMYTSANIPVTQSMDSPDYGFSKVTISYDRNGSSGKTEHYYSSSINGLNSEFHSNPGALNWGRGELIKTIRYDTSGAKLTEEKKTFKVYKTDNTLWGTPDSTKENYIYGVDIQLKRPELTDEAGGEYNLPYTYPARFEVEKFRIISAWYHPDSTITVSYDPTNSTLRQRTIEKRIYNTSSTQLSEVISTNSNNQRRRVGYTYASEKYPGMASAHMLTQPYEVSKWDLNVPGDSLLRVDWTLWKKDSINGRTVWKPCSKWIGGPGLGITEPVDPECG